MTILASWPNSRSTTLPASASFVRVRPIFWTIEHEVLCRDCALVEGVIRVRDDLAVEVERDPLLIQHGKAEVGVFPNEIRHLVNALAEAAARLVDGQMESTE